MPQNIIIALAALGLALPLIGCDTDKAHEELLALDSHLDTPLVLDRAGFDISHRHDWMTDYAQVDLPRMKEGGLDGGFWVIYTAQGPLTKTGYAKALAHARQRNQVIDDMVQTLGNDFAPAINADDAARIAASGKRVVYKSIENAYPLGTNIDLLDEFYAAGARMVGLVHSSNNQFADSSTDKGGQKWGGLSPLGRQLIRRANQLGMIVDMSHAHDEALAQAIELSKTPIILSHSGAAYLYQHPRNVPDYLLKKLAQSGGVIQINSLSGYLRDLNTSPNRLPEFIGLYRKYQNMPGGMRDNHKAFIADRRALDEKYPPDYAEFSDVMEHIFHALDVMGPDHVGIGLDWDGGGGVNGLQDVSDLPKITAALKKAAISPQIIEKIWSGNMLRLLRQAEAVRRR
jgi:membrane dipeptidase